MFVKKIIRAAFQAINFYLINRVQYQPAKEALLKLKQPFQDAAEKLTDDNPNNVEQMRQWFEQNKTVLAGVSLDGVKIWVETTVKDENLKALLLSILDSLDDSGNVRVPAV